MRNMREKLRERLQPGIDQDKHTGSPRVWLLSALVVCALALFCALYMLDMRAGQDGTVIDARTLRHAQETPQISQVQLPTRSAEPSQSMLRAVDISITLVIIADRASTVTGSVAMLNNRIDRIMAAVNAASNVVRFAEASAELAPGSDVAQVLRELATALTTYDIDRVRSTSLRLAELRQQLSSAISASQQTNNAPASLKLE